MHISEINRFADALSLACTQKKYITTNGSKIEVIDSKANKNINTVNIAKIADDCLAYITSSPNPMAQTLLAEKLQKALCSYSSRLHQSKPWWKKILSSFGYLSAEENKLNLIQNEINKIKQNSIKAESVIQKACQSEGTVEQKSQKAEKNSFHTDVIQIIRKGTEENHLLHDQLRKFYALVLGSSPFKMDSFDGYNPVGALNAYYDDLTTYSQFILAHNLPIPLEIEEAIDELKFAIENDKNPAQLKNILESIRLLPQGSKNLILCGGFFPKQQKKFSPGMGHGVLFKINKEQDSTYSFTIINRGDGAFLALLPEQEKQLESLQVLLAKIGVDFQSQQYLLNDEAYLDYLAEAIENLTPLDFGKFTEEEKYAFGKALKILSPQRVSDLQYTGIPFEKMTGEFFSKLLNVENYSNMHEVYEAINEQFQDAKQSKGPARKSQSKGICAFKCISSYLSQKLGKALYQDFKVFITKVEIEKLTNLKNSNGTLSVLGKLLLFSPKTLQSINVTFEMLNTMLSAGESVLNHRLEKC